MTHFCPPFQSEPETWFCHRCHVPSSGEQRRPSPLVTGKIALRRNSPAPRFRPREGAHLPADSISAAPLLGQATPAEGISDNAKKSLRWRVGFEARWAARV